MTVSGRRGKRAARGEDGAAMVEFAFVAVLLFMLIFGIISFGLILSFKQDMTRAAAEGARAGAVAVETPTQTVDEAAEERAVAATEEAVRSFGGSFSSAGCGRDGMTCEIQPPAPCAEQPALQCITVTLSYDYEDHPLYGRIPLIEAFLPDEIKAESVARINE